ncbi:MAG: hypothetical protein HWE27_16315 [Gammaproteobacteria bacterium]|nr:hypothetical protein [Gammaproteobacteria bacterium]
MISVVLFGVFVLVGLVVIISIINKSQSGLSKAYWQNVFVSGLLSSFSFGFLAWYNLFSYAFVVFILLIFVRELSKYLFNSKYGSVILGIICGLWLSLPIGTYFWVE